MLSVNTGSERLSEQASRQAGKQTKPSKRASAYEVLWQCQNCITNDNNNACARSISLQCLHICSFAHPTVKYAVCLSFFHLMLCVYDFVLLFFILRCWIRRLDSVFVYVDKSMQRLLCVCVFFCVSSSSSDNDIISVDFEPHHTVNLDRAHTSRSLSLALWTVRHSYACESMPISLCRYFSIFHFYCMRNSPTLTV